MFLGSLYTPMSNVMPVGKVAESVFDQQKQSSAAASASAINNNSHQNLTTKAAHLDSVNGVRTSDLYESGHFEANSELCGSDAGEHKRKYQMTTATMVETKHTENKFYLLNI